MSFLFMSKTANLNSALTKSYMDFFSVLSLDSQYTNVQQTMSRENGVSSLASPYGGPPVENPPPVVLVSAITGHPYQWTNFLSVASSNTIPATVRTISFIG